jgi:capsular polysaccharide biosynthesis protein
MDIAEAVHRIVGRHVRLIAGCVLVVVAVALFLGRHATAEYRATSRLVLDQGDPETQAQSSVAADTARALATGTGLVSAALDKRGIVRDARTVAEHHIRVQALGSSGVLALSVTDRDPNVAIALANELAEATVAARRAVIEGNSEVVSDQMKAQEADLRQQIDDVEQRLKALGHTESVATSGQAPSGQAQSAQAPWTTASQLLRLRGDLTNQLDNIISQRTQTEANQAGHPRGEVLDEAVRPAVRVGDQRPLDVALGGVLGLVLGLAIAAVIESLRPTLVGRAAIGRHLDAPVLAEFQGPPRTWTGADVAVAAMHIELASVPAQVDKVALVSIGRDGADAMDELAGALNEESESLTVAPLHLQSASLSWLHGNGIDSSRTHPWMWRYSDHPRTGLVILAPSTVLQDDLDRAVELGAITGWRLLGVLVYRASTSPRGYVRTRASRNDVVAQPVEPAS